MSNLHPLFQQLMEPYMPKATTEDRISVRLRAIAGDLAEIAANPPQAMDSKAMAKIASQILAIAGQVYLDELDAPRSSLTTGAKP
jgi:hypothetical protein